MAPQTLCRRLFCLLAVACALTQAQAREVATRAEIRSAYDWTQADRRDSREQLARDPRAAQASNTFVRSAMAITQALKPAEFQTMEERHAYYDLVAGLLEASPTQKVREVRFFHTVAASTGHDAAGMKDQLTGKILGREAQRLLEDINRDLFSANLPVVRGLLYAEHRAPGGGDFNALGFDIAMVEFEQGRVEKLLKERGFPAQAISRINLFIGLGPSIVAQRYSPIEAARRWVTRTGFAKEDFANRTWRVAMGRALVFFFHSRRPDAPPQEVRRTKRYLAQSSKPNRLEVAQLADLAN